MKKFQQENILGVQLLFLKLLSFVYLGAFASWVPQISQLYGPNGLLPVDVQYYDQINQKTFLQKQDQKNIITNLQSMPTLLWFSEDIHKILKMIPIFDGTNAYETTLLMICLLGTSLSLVILLDRKNRLLRFEPFLILWILYHSIYQVGQTFANFQWDVMLLEVGFLAMFFTPVYYKGVMYTDQMAVACRELLRGVAFKLFFSSGVLKLQSECPTWWDLTALHHHFQSQCIPHFLSWWAYQIPMEVKKIMVAGNFITLIFGAISFYFPVRGVRVIGFLLQFLMQVSIILTGNYNYFNILSICISLVVIDDEFLFSYLPKCVLRLLGLKQQFKQINLQHNKQGLIIGLLFWVLILALSFTYLFPINLILSEQTVLPFNSNDLHYYLINSYFMYFIEVMAFLFFAFYLIYFTLQSYRTTPFHRVHTLFKITLATVFFIIMGSLSMFTMKKGLGLSDPSTILDTQLVMKIAKYGQSLHLSSSYGLFRRMTGVEGRPELILEGSADGTTYSEYEFHFKPGNLQVSPVWVVPHQPRLDWQLWFAALNNGVHDPWLINFLYKILKGEQTVKLFLAYDPFPNQTPKFLRIKKYKYFFTNFTEMQQSSNFWKREFYSDFLNPLDLGSNELKQAINKFNFERTQQNSNNSINIWYFMILNFLVIESFQWRYK